MNDKMKMDVERVKFGEWYIGEFRRLAPSAGVLMHGMREIYWVGWQARASLPVDGGGVVVPRELLERMMQNPQHFLRGSTGHDELRALLAGRG